MIKLVLKIFHKFLITKMNWYYKFWKCVYLPTTCCNLQNWDINCYLFATNNLNFKTLKSIFRKWQLIFAENLYYNNVRVRPSLISNVIKFNSLLKISDNGDWKIRNYQPWNLFFGCKKHCRNYEFMKFKILEDIFVIQSSKIYSASTYKQRLGIGGGRGWYTPWPEKFWKYPPDDFGKYTPSPFF